MRKLHGFSVLIAAAALTAAATITAFAGWSEQNGRWYYYNDRNGELVRNEWVEDGGKWYFMDYDGVMMTNSMVDDVYFVNESGVMVANSWVYIYEDWANQEGWRYFGSNGRAYTNGWKEIGGTWYHFTDSIMDEGWQEIDNRTYYLGSSGAMRTGWQLLPDREDEWGEFWYYFNSSGRMAEDGEEKIGGETYIFDESGRMLTGWVNPSDYSSSGRDDLNGDHVDSLKYFESDGREADGWLYLNSPNDAEENWYYFRDGRAYTPSYQTTDVGSGLGMVRIDDETYCFDSEGRMVTGMVTLDNGKVFYFDLGSGEMLTGRVTINDDDHDDETFYFATTGGVGTKGAGYTGVRDGYLYNNGRLIMAEDGMKYERVSVDGKNYMVNERGQVKTSGTVTDGDGVKYKITRDGEDNYKIEVVED